MKVTMILDTDEIVSDMLREFRIQKKMTGSEVGKLIGISQGQISRIETGGSKCSIALLYLLTTLYEVSMPDFFREFEKRKAS